MQGKKQLLFARIARKKPPPKSLAKPQPALFFSPLRQLLDMHILLRERNVDGICGKGPVNALEKVMDSQALEPRIINPTERNQSRGKPIKVK